MAVPKTAALPLGYTPIMALKTDHPRHYKKKGFSARLNIILFSYVESFPYGGLFRGPENRQKQRAAL
jgi:hypothetical protein